ncbi:MAG: biopolymer transporter ExbD [Phycisphaerales bacterium]|nr:biopolymer transporter ExbD [Phycisphaerales bacterium]
MLNRPPKPVSLTLNLAPMVDVMMCLIVFFLLAARIVDAEHRPIELPWAKSATTTGAIDGGARIVINVQHIDDDQASYIVTGWDGRDLTDMALDADQLGPLLIAKSREAAARNDEIRCVIRADREVAYRHIERVLQACGEARIGRIAFAANSGDQPGEQP